MIGKPKQQPDGTWHSSAKGTWSSGPCNLQNLPRVRAVSANSGLCQTCGQHANEHGAIAHPFKEAM